MCSFFLRVIYIIYIYSDTYPFPLHSCAHVSVLTTEIFGAQVLVSMTDYSGDVGDLTGWVRWWFCEGCERVGF